MLKLINAARGLQSAMSATAPLLVNQLHVAQTIVRWINQSYFLEKMHFKGT